jgi:hypothetical protein
MRCYFQQEEGRCRTIPNDYLVKATTKPQQKTKKVTKKRERYRGEE